ncbi:protein jag [Metabacillus litoralis]|uniref:RNA-binding protein KhpB n=1 Tax=Metabacillus litoralis TaxID=152268 RepID=A0A5C6VW00_9BACI|nr:RNA-binding cell elongation regulator Jag/EloR [Metabacillus litoralis]TXC89407.1 protein jag [Metabacillus litoralis]
MKEVTANGHTVEEAVEAALKTLQATKDEIEITILEEGKKGILGIFGKKPAIVKVVLKQDPVKESHAFLSEVIRKMGIEAKIDVKKSGKTATFQITGDNMAVLIGKRGQTLNSLQFLTQLVANRYSDHYLQIIIDAENYRERRKETLILLAARLAQQVKRTSNKASLEPMPSNERKIIHAALAKYPELKTYSVGEEPNRHLVISPKKKG